MERTPSRRPTRQRRLNPPSAPPNESFFLNPSHGGSPDERHRDDPLPRPPPVLTPPNPRLSPLPPVLEDASTSGSHFAFHSAPPSGSPPGLSVRSPCLRALPPPTPSPLSLSSPLVSCTPSPKPSSRAVSPIPLYFHPRSGPVSPHFKKQSNPDSQMPLFFPALTRCASVPDELALEAGKGPLSQSSCSGDIPSPKWKPLGLPGINANSSSPSLNSGKNVLNSPPVTSPVKSWRTGKGLVGWELKRNGCGSGKLGFGLVRKGSTGA